MHKVQNAKKEEYYGDKLVNIMENRWPKSCVQIVQGQVQPLMVWWEAKQGGWTVCSLFYFILGFFLLIFSPYFDYSWFTICCQFLLYSKVTQLYMYVHILFLILYSIMFYHKWLDRSSCCGVLEMNLTRNHDIAGLIPGLTWWVRIWHCCELWCRSQTCLGSGVGVAVV